MLGIVAYVIGSFAPSPVTERAHFVGLERYVLIWLFLVLFLLAIQAINEWGSDEERRRD